MTISSVNKIIPMDRIKLQATLKTSPLRNSVNSNSSEFLLNSTNCIETVLTRLHGWALCPFSEKKIMWCCSGDQLKG